MSISALRRSATLSLPIALGMALALWPSLTQAEGVFTDISPPTISGNTVEGEILTVIPGKWTAQPSKTLDQWQRCNQAGSDCEAISKATGQSYRLVAEDVGFTIRVSESATDAAGAVTPATSEPTASVQAHGSSGHGGETGGGGGGGSGESGSQGGSSNSPGHSQTATLAALLARQLAPSAKSDSISTLLRHGGLSMTFTLPDSGTLTVDWYLQSSASARGKHAKRVPLLLAQGKATVSAKRSAKLEIRLTRQGKAQLARHVSRLDVEASGVFTPKGASKVTATKRFVLAR